MDWGDWPNRIDGIEQRRERSKENNKGCDILFIIVFN
jgi:hypothetical protein